MQFPGQFPAEHILVSFMFSPEYQAEETLLEQAESYLKNIDITNEFEDAINDFYELKLFEKYRYY